jgi:hypothetical protein
VSRLNRSATWPAFQGAVPSFRSTTTGAAISAIARTTRAMIVTVTGSAAIAVSAHPVCATAMRTAYAIATRR